jgi:hypothetical protein
MANGESTASPSGEPREPPVAFVHIPETAGGAAISMLTNAYGRAGVRNVANYLSGKENAVSKVSRALRRTGPRVFVGHVPLGVFLQHLPDDTRYVTILREPVERVLSHDYRPMGSRRRKGAAKPPQQTLEEVLALRLPPVSNLQTRLLCNDPDLPAEMPPEALDQARANLDRMVFVGLQERFDESLVLMQRTLGIETVVPYVRNRHVGGERPSAPDLDPAQRALIEEANALDIELYEYGRALFEEAVEGAGEGFDVDVKKVRAQRAAAASEAEAVTAAATQWLQEQLPPGASRRVDELLEAATAAGLAHDAVQRAARQLRGIRRSGQDEEGHKVWTSRDASTEADRAESNEARRAAKEARRAAAKEADEGAVKEARRATKAERRRNGGKKRRAADGEVAPEVQARP